MSELKRADVYALCIKCLLKGSRDEMCLKCVLMKPSVRELVRKNPYVKRIVSKECVDYEDVVKLSASQDKCNGLLDSGYVPALEENEDLKCFYCLYKLETNREISNACHEDCRKSWWQDNKQWK